MISPELLGQCFQVEIVVPTTVAASDGILISSVYEVAYGADGNGAVWVGGHGVC